MSLCTEWAQKHSSISGSHIMKTYWNMLFDMVTLHILTQNFSLITSRISVHPPTPLGQWNSRCHSSNSNMVCAHSLPNDQTLLIFLWLLYQWFYLILKVPPYIIHFDLILVRVFANGPRRSGFNPRSSHTKNSKSGTWCCLA